MNPLKTARSRWKVGTTNTAKSKKKEIKFFNILHRVCSCASDYVSSVVVPHVGPQKKRPLYTSILSSVPITSSNTKNFTFLISEFSYPSDFRAIKTRLSSVCRFGDNKKKTVFLLQDCVWDFFSRSFFCFFVHFVFGEVERKRNTKIKKNKKINLSCVKWRSLLKLLNLVISFHERNEKRICGKRRQSKAIQFLTGFLEIPTKEPKKKFSCLSRIAKKQQENAN